MNVDDIIDALSVIAPDAHHTNMYRDNGCCPLPFEPAGSASDLAVLRLRNLREHLDVRQNAPMILVGEAAGWRGARQTGVAFTAPHNLAGIGMREASATTVQRALDDFAVSGQVILWNACVLHPHVAGTPASNVAPSSSALAASAEVLRAVVEGRFVIAVGNYAARAMTAAGITVARPDEITASSGAVQVRHPSYGGAKEFRQGLAAAVAASLTV